MNHLNFLMLFTGVKVTGSKIDEWAFANKDRPTGKLQLVESVSFSNIQIVLSIVDPDVFLNFKHFPAIIIIVHFSLPSLFLALYNVFVFFSTCMTPTQR